MRVRRVVVILLVLLGLLAGSAHAGRRVGPVASRCPAEAQTREVDAAGVEDQCVSRTPPRCKAGRKLSLDSGGEADRCLPEAGAGKAGDEGDEPTCAVGLKLKPRPGEDLCERVEKPRCVSGFKLKATPGEDRCVP